MCTTWKARHRRCMLSRYVASARSLKESSAGTTYGIDSKDPDVDLLVPLELRLFASAVAASSVCASGNATVSWKMAQ